MLDLTATRDRTRCRRVLAPLACAFFLLANHTASATDTPHPPWRRALSDAALVTLFQSVLSPASADVVNCLGWDGADAPPRVLAALQSAGRRVVPASACQQRAQAPGSYERSTRQPAEFNELGPFEQISRGRAIVPFRSYRHGLWGSSGRCHLTADGEDWRVERCDVEIVS